MAKWEQLIAARERKHLSQMEAAEYLNVGLVTYQRWEMGKRKPQPQHMRHLCEQFGIESDPSLSKPDASYSIAGLPLAQPSPTPAGETIAELSLLLTTNMTASLWSQAFRDHATCQEKRDTIRQTIKEFDHMNKDNKNYQITRREALWSLTTLPMITLGLNASESMVPANQYGTTLAHCAASLESCWELYRSGDPHETVLAFKCASTYLPLLQTIGKDSSIYRKEAIDLATRYALVKTLLGWICVGPNETLQYAKEAVALSKETGDLSLQLSAYSKLAWAYFYLKKNGPALSTALEAETLLTSSPFAPNMQPVHSCVYAGTYSTLALMQAKNGQSPANALGKALESNPEESFAFMTSKRSTLLLEAGWTYCSYGDQTQATAILEQRVDAETLQPRLVQSTMGQIETFNVMALSSLKSKNRDMEKTIHLWTAGIEGAKMLQNEQRFHEAITNYELMEVVWPGEPRIADLRDHLTHWDVA